MPTGYILAFPLVKIMFKVATKAIQKYTKFAKPTTRTHSDASFWSFLGNCKLKFFVGYIVDIMS